MILPNGYIRIKTMSEVAEIDPLTGYPKQQSEEWGEGIKCQYLTNKYDAMAVAQSGSKYTLSDYSVLIDERPFKADSVRLETLDGDVIGEFSVRSIESLQAVRQIKIWL